jgi:ribosomal protein S18 acetylase RimI-like enzyme
VRAFAGEPEVEAYVAMHRDAWSDLRPSTYTVEAHRCVMALPGYAPELNPVVVATDGALAAGCVCWLDRRNRTAEIEPLGTRPAFRRRGLARALVLDALGRMRAHGADRALVYGISGNEPARRLYLSTGFVPGRRILVYRRSAP